MEENVRIYLVEWCPSEPAPGPIDHEWFRTFPEAVCALNKRLLEDDAWAVDGLVDGWAKREHDGFDYVLRAIDLPEKYLKDPQALKLYLYAGGGLTY